MSASTDTLRAEVSEHAGQHITPDHGINRLLAIMAALRTPVTGCAWDLAQTHESLKPYVLDEAYEVMDAITHGDMTDLCEELGDLLLQIVFHAQLAQEQGAFCFGDVVAAISQKLIRRHPHVFKNVIGNTGTQVTPEAVAAQWEAIKATEKRLKAETRRALGLSNGTHETLLSSVKQGLSPQKRAKALQAKAASVGFDWPSPQDVLDKLEEEILELRAALQAQEPTTGGESARGKNEAACAEEFADMMFVMANLARHLNLDCDDALTRANAKFTRRFTFIEQEFERQGKTLGASSLAEMEALWQQAKGAENV